MALLPAGCDDASESPDPRPDAEVAGWIELGTGSRRFEPLTADQRVPVIEGPQGGYHVWASLRGDDFDDEGVDIDFELRDGDTLIASARLREPFLDRPTPQAPYELAAVTVVFEDNDTARRANGQPMTLSVRVAPRATGALTTRTVVRPECCTWVFDEP